MDDVFRPRNHDIAGLGLDRGSMIEVLLFSRRGGGIILYCMKLNYPPPQKYGQEVSPVHLPHYIQQTPPSPEPQNLAILASCI